MYYEKMIISGKVIEVIKSYSKSEVKNNDRGPKTKETDEQMKKANERNAVRKLTRILNTNYRDGDLHIVLTYKKDKRPNPEGAKKEFNNFIRRINYRFKKEEKECRWLMVTEYKNKAIHHHLIISNPEGLDTVNLCMEQWRKQGMVHATPLYSRGNYKELAEYLVKETSKTYKEKDGGHMQRWTSSRNMKKPKIIIRKRKAGRWSQNPQPKKGYELVKDSVYTGTNGFTGREYQYYMMLQKEDKRSG